MPSLLHLLSGATILSSALATPVAGPDPDPEADSWVSLQKRGHFSIKQKSVQRASSWIAPAAIRRTYLKYNAELPDGLHGIAEAAIAAVANGTASVPAIPERNDIEYLTPVNIGGKQLMLDFDTGSADLWCFSSHLPTSQQRSHSIYNPDTSGRRLNGHSWRIMYGDASGASGVVYADKVAVGPVTATSQAVEAATSISAQFVADTANDGLLGLAFAQLNQVKPERQKTFFDSVKGSLAKPLFTANLKKGQPGTYDFGYIDTAKYTGDLVYVPVDTSEGHWAFYTDGFAIGNGPTQRLRTLALPDTGSSLWYVPSAMARAYWAQVPDARWADSQAGYVVPCDAQLPDIKVVVGGKQLVVPGKNMQYARVGVMVATGATVCFGGIQPDTGMPFSIFGDVFLKGLFAVFDESGGEGGKPRIGFAQQRA